MNHLVFYYIIKKGFFFWFHIYHTRWNLLQPFLRFLSIKLHWSYIKPGDHDARSRSDLSQNPKSRDLETVYTVQVIPLIGVARNRTCSIFMQEIVASFRFFFCCQHKNVGVTVWLHCTLKPTFSLCWQQITIFKSGGTASCTRLCFKSRGSVWGISRRVKSLRLLASWAPGLTH